MWPDLLIDYALTVTTVSLRVDWSNGQHIFIEFLARSQHIELLTSKLLSSSGWWIDIYEAVCLLHSFLSFRRQTFWHRLVWLWHICSEAKEQTARKKANTASDKVIIITRPSCHFEVCIIYNFYIYSLGFHFCIYIVIFFSLSFAASTQSTSCSCLTLFIQHTYIFMSPVFICLLVCVWACFSFNFKRNARTTYMRTVLRIRNVLFGHALLCNVCIIHYGQALALIPSAPQMIFN